jgi:hypothetical protein
VQTVQPSTVQEETLAMAMAGVIATRSNASALESGLGKGVIRCGARTTAWAMGSVILRLVSVRAELVLLGRTAPLRIAPQSVDTASAMQLCKIVLVNLAGLAKLVTKSGISVEDSAQKTRSVTRTPRNVCAKPLTMVASVT